MKRIEGRARTVKELLDGGKYTIDFYQREYAWQERQVRELVDDLAGKFLDFHEPDHERAEVEDYGHYFLGPIVISHKRSQKFIVDGQQRLTTLTLLLIHLHHMQAGCDGAVDVSNLIFSEKFGRKSFNLDVPDRVDVMQTLLEGRRNIPEDAPESVQNISRVMKISRITSPTIFAGDPSRSLPTGYSRTFISSRSRHTLTKMPTPFLKR